MDVGGHWADRISFILDVYGKSVEDEEEQRETGNGETSWVATRVILLKDTQNLN